VVITLAAELVHQLRVPLQAGVLVVVATDLLPQVLHKQAVLEQSTQVQVELEWVVAMLAFSRLQVLAVQVSSSLVILDHKKQLVEM
jgi:hypothetical protein